MMIMKAMIIAVGLSEIGEIIAKTKKNVNATSALTVAKQKKFTNL